MVNSSLNPDSGNYLIRVDLFMGHKTKGYIPSPIKIRLQ